MIFTMPELKQAALTDPGVSLGRSAVEPHPVAVHLINPQHRPVQCGFQLGPGCGVRQPIQDIGQPIVAQVQRAHRLAQTGGQRVAVRLHPRLDMGQAVIALRNDKRQPHRHHIAQTQVAFPVTMGRIELIQQGWKLHLVDLGQYHREVVDAFDVKQADHLVQHRGYR